MDTDSCSSNIYYSDTDSVIPMHKLETQHPFVSNQLFINDEDVFSSC